MDNRAVKFIMKAAWAAGLLVVIFIIWSWVCVSTQVARVTFSQDRYCRLQFHEWNSGRAVLSYYEKGALVGRVQLNNDLFNDPLAMFPGPDGHSVVCLSWPDTFDTAFTVDFSKYNREGVKIPERLRLGGQEVVDFSNFEVRACTTAEVNFVRHFIEGTDLKTLGLCTRWGSPATEDTRKYTLHFLGWATARVNGEGAPLILPEDSLAEETHQ